MPQAEILRTEPDGATLCCCGECRREYWIVPKGYWRNYFLCGEACCYARRQKLAEQQRLEQAADD